ncbi:MAG: DUF3303 domain-containing protein [Candidatus Thorarchaeota archaeon]
MRFLIEWEIKPKYRQAANKALEKFEQPKEVKTIFAAHNRIASSTGIAVVEVDDVALIQKTLSPMMDFTNFKVTPIRPLFTE